eukprot:gene20884-23716_t
MGASRLLKVRQTTNDKEIRPEGKSADLLDDDPHKIANSLNVDGNLYVAESCIGCGACQWMCPSVFAKGGLRAYVKKQPENNDESLAAFAAMSACPSGSIHTRAYDTMIEKAKDVFPAEIDPVNLPGVYHAGFHTPENFGSTPYFIKRTGGNVLIGTPRFNERMADIMEQEGGLKYLILPQREPNVYHIEWKKRFPKLERIVHRTDNHPDLSSFEVKLDGINRKWVVAPDLEIIHTPGYKLGSVSVLYTPINAIDPPSNHQSHNSTTTAPADNVIDRNFEIGSVQEITAQPVGTLKSVLFPGELNPTGLITIITGMQTVTMDNPYGESIHVRTLKMLAHENIRFGWMMSSHEKPLHFKSLQEKADAILEYANTLDTERKKGNELYENILDSM